MHALARSALIGAVVLTLATGSVAAAGSDEPIKRQTDNISFVAHAQYPQGTDLFFQRRDGRHRLDGRTVQGPRDYAFGGADATAAVGQPPPGTPKGVRIFDVTDPTDPVQLVAVNCPGYHADVAVYEELLVQAIDVAGTNEGCADEFDPRGVDRSGVAGVRIYDIADPAQPTVAGFVDADTLGTSVHNVTTLPWAGLLYIAGSDFTRTDPVFAIVDLTDPDFAVKVIPMRDISPTATAECHDIGVADLGHRALAFCAAVTETFIWDVSDPWNPRQVAVVPAVESIHHGARLAPDGQTLVLGDELGGAALALGCAGTEEDPLGALWFYDVSIPEVPVPLGSFTTSELSTDLPCTSHWYNFIPGTSLLTVGWYKSGMIVVDYANRTRPTEHAVFAPEGGNFWASYFWRGYIYGSSFGGGGLIGGDDAAGGLWVTQLEGVGDIAPSPHDRGTSWAPWTPPSNGKSR